MHQIDKKLLCCFVKAHMIFSGSASQAVFLTVKGKLCIRKTKINNVYVIVGSDVTEEGSSSSNIDTDKT